MVMINGSKRHVWKTEISVRPVPSIPFETRSSGRINGVVEFWIRDMKFVGIDSYYRPVLLMELCNLVPISAPKIDIVIYLIPKAGLRMR